MFVFTFIVQVEAPYAVLLANISKVYLRNFIQTCAGKSADQRPPFLIVLANKVVAIAGDRVEDRNYLWIGKGFSLARGPLLVLACVSAWNKDPVSGVIGIQKGPL
ncbi:hypothetical protein ABMA46_14815 [Mesorhizobium sp. CN5-321]|uniref:hypothetical protein n=1 Tax=Mesorhizobium hunchu TaxID=3157708 RepID=UPI0032B718A7